MKNTTIEELVETEIKRLTQNLEISRVNATGGRRTLTPEQQPRAQHAHGALEAIADFKILLISNGHLKIKLDS